MLTSVMPCVFGLCVSSACLPACLWLLLCYFLQSVALCDALPYAFNVTLDCKAIPSMPNVSFVIAGHPFSISVGDYAYQVRFSWPLGWGGGWLPLQKVYTDA